MATYELIEDEFVVEPRGAIPIKGKGEMEAWYLVGRRSWSDTQSLTATSTRAAQSGNSP